MTLERMIKLLVLHQIKLEFHDNSYFKKWLEENYDVDEIDCDYIPLLEEFLTDYALDKTEKSD